MRPSPFRKHTCFVVFVSMLASSGLASPTNFSDFAVLGDTSKREPRKLAAAQRGSVIENAVVYACIEHRESVLKWSRIFESQGLKDVWVMVRGDDCTDAHDGYFQSAVP